MKPKKPVYEMWTFIDHGVVFSYGSAKPTAVQMVHGRFEATDEKDASSALASDLQRVERVDVK